MKVPRFKIEPNYMYLYMISGMIMRKLIEYPGIKVETHNVNNLRYADDTVFIAENKAVLQQLLHIAE